MLVSFIWYLKYNTGVGGIVKKREGLSGSEIP